MGAVELLVELLAGENCLIAVDDNNVFAAVNVGRELGTMLAPENIGSSNGSLAKRFAGCVIPPNEYI